MRSKEEKSGHKTVSNKYLDKFFFLRLFHNVMCDLV